MKTLYTLLFFFVASAIYAQAEAPLTCPQNQSGIVFMLGPSVNYYQGGDVTSSEKFDAEVINYQLNGFIGYNSPHTKAKNSVGIFGTGGYTNEATFIKIKEVQGLNTGELVINKYYAFYQVEAGMIIGNVLRLSTGLGKQEFQTVSGSDSYAFFSSTAGLLINLGPVGWNIDANINYGRDYPKTAIRFVTGLVIMF